MKKLIFAVAAAISAVAMAEEPVVAQTIRADGTTNTWTQADLQAALGLMNRMYWRDQETDSGRKKWHGERIGEYLLPTGVTNANGQVRSRTRRPPRRLPPRRSAGQRRRAPPGSLRTSRRTSPPFARRSGLRARRTRSR